MYLTRLGWNERLSSLFAVHGARGLLPARVLSAERGRYQVSDGQREWAAQISGRMRHAAQASAELPTPGDWVALRPACDGGPALIEHVLARKTCFRRQAAGYRTEQQILAANVDGLLVVVGLDGDYSLRRIERYLTASDDSGAEVAVVLNKADCRPDAARLKAEAQSVRPGLLVLVVSAVTGEGLRDLEALLRPGLTYALVGSSGVGKSSLINRLLGADRQATSAVRTRDDRGCHTTTRREVLLLPQGPIVMDTPGLRELALWAAGDTPWQAAFTDVAELGERCRYRDCQHRSEPGCAVRAALEQGELSPERYQSYLKQLSELAYQRARQDQRARQLKDDWRRGIARASRQRAKMKGKWS